MRLVDVLKEQVERQGVTHQAWLTQRGLTCHKQNVWRWLHLGVPNRMVPTLLSATGAASQVALLELAERLGVSVDSAHHLALMAVDSDLGARVLARSMRLDTEADARVWARRAVGAPE